MRRTEERYQPAKYNFKLARFPQAKNFYFHVVKRETMGLVAVLLYGLSSDGIMFSER